MLQCQKTGLQSVRSGPSPLRLHTHTLTPALSQGERVHAQPKKYNCYQGRWGTQWPSAPRGVSPPVALRVERKVQCPGWSPSPRNHRPW
jgi:hypothetical protein